MADNLKISLCEFMNTFVRQIDGKAWIVTLFFSLVIFIDLLIGTKFIPVRKHDDFNTAVTLLSFSPLLIFVVLVWLRQLPFTSSRYSGWFRVIVCFWMFFGINF
ncbi:MAG: hypothetical protein LBU53_05360 [Zoogloeaceae bacterium]|jgi:hypothetical protein|nr:hypothetical protein [Zoogloeaceae bacterium]